MVIGAIIVAVLLFWWGYWLSPAVPAGPDYRRYLFEVTGGVRPNRKAQDPQDPAFDALREGLPQAHAYDLVYRHGLTVSADGKRLAFGSTTGGVWTSDDQGDSWQQLPARLPMVHAVCLC